MNHRNEIREAKQEAQYTYKVNKDSLDLLEKAGSKLERIDSPIQRLKSFEDEWKKMFQDNVNSHLKKMDKLCTDNTSI